MIMAGRDPLFSGRIEMVTTMRRGAILSITLAVALCSGATAGDNASGSQTPGYRSGSNSGMTGKDNAGRVAQRTAFVPCVGRGYVPYSYPAVDSCPCAANGCFHPWRYYCGGRTYKGNWFRTWVGAHLGKGSMLDQYPCECQFPTVGRTYMSSPSTTPKTGVVPPKPSGPQN